MTLGKSSGRRGDRNGVAAGDRGGLRHHGRAAGSRERGCCLAGEFHRHGRRTLCLDRHLWTGFRSALQSGCFCGECLGGQHLGASAASSMYWRRFGGALPVSPRRTRCLDCRSFNSRCTCSTDPRRRLGEIDRDLRLGVGYFTRVAISRRGDPDSRCCFHHERLLVYLFDIFANPAVTFARAMTDTFAGISPQSVPLFVGGQLVGAASLRCLRAGCSDDKRG